MATPGTAAKKKNGNRKRGDLSFDIPRLTAVAASAAHVGQIQACFDGAPDYFARTDGKAPPSDAALQLLSDAEADASRRVYALVPKAGGPAVGVLDLHLDYPEPGTGHIGLLLFREACQGLGYGKETTTAVEDALRRAGYTALRLSVVDENVDAKMFWERLGFAEVGKLEDAVTVYEKPLR
jgi:ribosomal protein S18 acetylase RimI-like enzyme